MEVERKQRPSYPSDEAYRNRRLPHLYPHGDMLVLVDKAVYNAVAASIDQYVLDVGRDVHEGVAAVEHARPDLVEVARSIARKRSAKSCRYSKLYPQAQASRCATGRRYRRSLV